MLLNKLKIIADRFEEFLCSVMLGYIAVTLNIEVFNRYVLNSPSAYTDEISRTLMIFIVFIGIPWAVKTERHIIIDLLPKDSKYLLRLILEIVSKVLFSILCVLLVYASYLAIEFHHMLGSTTEGLELPLWLLLCVIPGSALLTIVRLVQSILKSINSYKVNVSQQKTIEGEKYGVI